MALSFVASNVLKPAAMHVGRYAWNEAKKYGQARLEDQVNRVKSDMDKRFFSRDTTPSKAPQTLHEKVSALKYRKPATQAYNNNRPWQADQEPPTRSQKNKIDRSMKMDAFKNSASKKYQSVAKAAKRSVGVAKSSAKIVGNALGNVAQSAKSSVGKSFNKFFKRGKGRRGRKPAKRLGKKKFFK